MGGIKTPLSTYVCLITINFLLIFGQFNGVKGYYLRGDEPGREMRHHIEGHREQPQLKAIYQPARYILQGSPEYAFIQRATENQGRKTEALDRAEVPAGSILMRSEPCLDAHGKDCVTHGMLHWYDKNSPSFEILSNPANIMSYLGSENPQDIISPPSQYIVRPPTGQNFAQQQRPVPMIDPDASHVKPLEPSNEPRPPMPLRVQSANKKAQLPLEGKEQLEAPENIRPIEHVFPPPGVKLEEPLVFKGHPADEVVPLEGKEPLLLESPPKLEGVSEPLVAPPLPYLPAEAVLHESAEPLAPLKLEESPALNGHPGGAVPLEENRPLPLVSPPLVDGISGPHEEPPPHLPQAVLSESAKLNPPLKLDGGVLNNGPSGEVDPVLEENPLEPRPKLEGISGSEEAPPHLPEVLLNEDAKPSPPLKLKGVPEEKLESEAPLHSAEVAEAEHKLPEVKEGAIAPLTEKVSLPLDAPSEKIEKRELEAPPLLLTFNAANLPKETEDEKLLLNSSLEHREQPFHLNPPILQEPAADEKPHLDAYIEQGPAPLVELQEEHTELLFPEKPFPLPHNLSLSENASLPHVDPHSNVSRDSLSDFFKQQMINHDLFGPTAGPHILSLIPPHLLKPLNFPSKPIELENGTTFSPSKPNLIELVILSVLAPKVNHSGNGAGDELPQDFKPSPVMISSHKLPEVVPIPSLPPQELPLLNSTLPEHEQRNSSLLEHDRKLLNLNETSTPTPVLF